MDIYIDSITNEIIQNDKKYKFTPNLSPEESEALKQLRNDNTVIIKKADKGSTVVLMNRDDYITEVERQLNDTKFYKKKLDENPQEKFRKDIDEVIKTIELSKSIRESIIPPGSDRIPIFYVLPKIHKELDSELLLGYPGRPISQAVVHLLKIFQHMLISYLSPTWNRCLRTLRIHLILLQKFTT